MEMYLKVLRVVMGEKRREYGWLERIFYVRMDMVRGEKGSIKRTLRTMCKEGQNSALSRARSLQTTSTK